MMKQAMPMERPAMFKKDNPDSQGKDFDYLEENVRERSILVHYRTEEKGLSGKII